ncbi:MAG: DUF2240 family protein [Candidatus Aenigmarchaeota archaeon]|nr:DUF2240 family protein [Candidatus Aenigmarchaeota archaeon]
MEYDTILKKIIEETKQSKEQIEALILEKQEELSNLVSKEGAAYIVARELGINLFEQKKKDLQIKNIIPGARNITFEARIVSIYPVKKFNNNGRQSKVANIILGDTTGTIRLSLWDEQTNILDGIEKGMPVQVFGAYTKEDHRGLVEVRLSRVGGLKILEHSDIPEIKPDNAIRRKKICDLKESMYTELKAALVQIFDTNNFYAICPKCGKKVNKENNEFVCIEHGKVEPKYSMVFSGVIDDGYGNIRAVFFRDAALNAVGMTIDQALENKDHLFDNILGKEFILTGSARINKMFNRLEFVVNKVEPVDPKQEIKNILNTMEKGD